MTYETDDRKKTKIVTAGLVCLGLLLAGFFPGYYYYKTYKTNNSVVVKGLAEMDVRADLAVWNVKFTVSGDVFSSLQSKIKSQLGDVMGFLKAAGFSEDEIKADSVAVSDKQANQWNDMKGVRYIVSQSLEIRSKKVDAVEKAGREIGSLVSKGIVFEADEYRSRVKYAFTGLNDIKPKMLEESTRNAKEAAAEFARASGSSVGKIRKASQGVFSILPRDGEDRGEAYSIDKKIRVVSTIEYWLD